MIFTDSPKKRPVDLRLYAIIDPAHAGGHALVDLARSVVAGGATLVQLRDKAGDTRTMIARARAIKAALPAHIPLVVNDRVDVALAADADGVHVGQEDICVEDARKILGPTRLIGLSIKTVDQAYAAPVDLLDYVGIGGVFGTTSKDNPRPPIGVEGLGAIVKVFRERSAHLPLCAIAGIHAGNAAAVMAAGVDGVAVISALSLAPDPVAAARELRAVVDAARAKPATVQPVAGAAGPRAEREA